MEAKDLKQAIKFASIATKAFLKSPFDAKHARKLLISGLADSTGISTKMAQLLSHKMGFSQNLASPNCLGISEIKHLIEASSPLLAKKIVEIQEFGKAASIGQVHEALLDDGSRVAIKVQYPNVQQSLADELHFIFNAANLGGPAKKYNLNTNLYKEILLDHFMCETDYLIEAKNQTLFKEKLESRFPGKIVVPKVFEDLSTKQVLVQEYIESAPFENYIDHSSTLQKIDLVQNFIDSVFYQIFEMGWVHNDLQPANWGVQDNKVVFYDFGSTLRLEYNKMNALKQMIRLSYSGQSFPILDYLDYLGFEAEKIGLIRSQMPLLWQELLKPFMVDRPFKTSDWNIGRRFDQVLGEEKWWFRTAGPPWFMLLMRSFSSIVFVLKQSGVAVNLNAILRNHMNIEDLSKPLVIPKSKISVQSQVTLSDDFAKHICVTVKDKKTGKNIADIKMPSAAVYDLESLIPDSAKAQLISEGKTLESLQNQVLKSGLKPQIIWEGETPERLMKFWLS